MLKAAIIYIPGCGGSFLRRTLSLSDQLIFEKAFETKSSQEKFSLFNNWNESDWKSAETLYRPLYRLGRQDFVDFKVSNLFLIDAWHPTEFTEHDRSQKCWEKGAWPNLIIINVNESFRQFIESNRVRKKYSVDWNKEQQAITDIREIYQDRIIDLDFTDMLNEQKFLRQIESISFKLSLNLEISLASSLWQTWFDKSNKIWQK